MVEKVLYAELTPKEFRARLKAAPIGYLPLGTLEWHGEHLPIGADGIQSQGFFERLAREAGGIVLPMLFLGPDRMRREGDQELYGMDFCTQKVGHQPGCPHAQLPGSAYWVPEETFRAILEAVLKQLRRAGFRIVVAHGHGPSTNFFRDHAGEWRQKFGLRCFVCWGGNEEEPDLGIQVDHAAANETSLVMALRPELVQMENLPADPNQWPLAVSGRDPRKHASPELGRRAIERNVARMAVILREALSQLKSHGEAQP
jgi:creatinine amidohydrolase